MQLDYLGVLKRAAEITWKYKFLWVLGILIALASGGGNPGSSANYQFSGSDTSQASSSLGSMVNAYLALILFIVVIIAILGFIVWILSVMANAGLIGSVAKIQKGEKTSLSDAFGIGARSFFRMLGAIILGGLLGLIGFIEFLVSLGSVIVAAVGAGMMLSNDQTMIFGVFCLVALILIGVFLLIVVIAGIVAKAITVAVIEIFAFRFLVIKRTKVVESIREAMKLIGSRTSQTIVMYLLLMLVSVIAGVILLIPGLLLFMLAFPVLVAGAMAKNVGIILISVALFIFMGFVMVFLNGILQTYMSTAWTLAFLQLTKEGSGPQAGTIPALPKAPAVPKLSGKPKTPSKPRPAREKTPRKSTSRKKSMPS
ncbi:MAG: hypothetical protein ABH838_01210 [Actinomycetota bacterium]